MNSLLRRITSYLSRCVICLFHFVLNADDKQPAPSLKGQFGPNGALYSGWETRRHNPTYDWCIIRLGTSGTIHGLDIDTANFNGNTNQVLFRHDISPNSVGNEAPAVSVYALFDEDSNGPTHE